MNYSEKISKKLNTLLQKTYDAKKGYVLDLVIVYCRE